MNHGGTYADIPRAPGQRCRRSVRRSPSRRRTPSTRKRGRRRRERKKKNNNKTPVLTRTDIFVRFSLSLSIYLSILGGAEVGRSVHRHWPRRSFSRNPRGVVDDNVRPRNRSTGTEVNNTVLLLQARARGNTCDGARRGGESVPSTGGMLRKGQRWMVRPEAARASFPRSGLYVHCNNVGALRARRATDHILKVVLVGMVNDRPRPRPTDSVPRPAPVSVDIASYPLYAHRCRVSFFFRAETLADGRWSLHGFTASSSAP